MSSIIQCSKCGQRYHLKKASRRSVRCRVCGSEIPVSPTSQAEPMVATSSNVNELLAEEEASAKTELPLPVAGPACPECGSGLPPGAVLCVQCGMDLRSGRQLATQSRSSPQRRCPRCETPIHEAKEEVVFCPNCNCDLRRASEELAGVESEAEKRRQAEGRRLPCPKCGRMETDYADARKRRELPDWRWWRLQPAWFCKACGTCWQPPLSRISVGLAIVAALCLLVPIASSRGAVVMAWMGVVLVVPTFAVAKYTWARQIVTWVGNLTIGWLVWMVVSFSAAFGEAVGGIPAAVTLANAKVKFFNWKKVRRTWPLLDPLGTGAIAVILAALLGLLGPALVAPDRQSEPTRQHEPKASGQPAVEAGDDSNKGIVHRHDPDANRLDLQGDR